MTQGEGRSLRILLMGATGYIGGRLAPRLAQEGHRCLTRRPERLAGRPWAHGVEIVQGDAHSSGPAKNVAVMSEVQASYASPGRALIAAAVPGLEALDPTITIRVRDQLARWFGSMTGDWEHLRTDVITHGQPAQSPPLHPKQPIALGEGRFVCGDHRDTASIQGALFSGRRTASSVLDHLGVTAARGSDA